MGGGADKRLVVRKRQELGEEGRNLESKRGRRGDGDRRGERRDGERRGGDGRERAGGRWKDCAGEEEVCQELGREKR